MPTIPDPIPTSGIEAFEFAVAAPDAEEPTTPTALTEDEVERLAVHLAEQVTRLADHFGGPAYSWEIRDSVADRLRAECDAES